MKHCTHSSVSHPLYGCGSAPKLESINLEKAKGQKALSTSHVFKGPLVISLISLLQQSRGGNVGVHSVDIDVRSTDAGIELVRGNGRDVLYERDSRSWCGTSDGFGLLGSATEFVLTLLENDEVVINWTEIKK